MYGPFRTPNHRPSRRRDRYIFSEGAPAIDPWVIYNLQAVAFDDDRIDLTWDPVETAGGILAFYEIERDSVVIDTSLDETYSDTGLSPATEYDYRVRAVETTA